MFQKLLLRIGYYPTRFRCHFLRMLAAVLSDSLSSCSLLGVPLDAKEEEPSSVPLAKRSKDHTDRTSQLPRFLYPYSSISHKINGISNITLFYVTFCGKEHVCSPVRVIKRATVAGWKTCQR